MLRRLRFRPTLRATAWVSAAVLLTAGLAALAPTAQADTQTLLTRTSVSWTDSAHPATTRTTGAIQAGTRLDAGGVAHTSRVYATFDLTALAGRKVSSAYFFVNGDPANSCRAIQYLDVRQTATPTAPVTWANPPAEGALIGSITPASPICPGTYAEGDASSLIESAVAAGQTSVSLELRVPAAQESDPAYLAKLSSDPIDISVTSDGAPVIDTTRLATQGAACSTSAPSYTWTATPQLAMWFSDPDSQSGTATWALWPAGQPTARTTYTTDVFQFGANTLSVPSGLIADGSTWSWSVKVSDGELSTPWTTACRFRVEATPPTVPTVTSTSIDSNGRAPSGQPVQVTFTSTSPDTVLFEWSWDSDFPVILPGEHYADSVRPDPATGTATVDLSPPQVGWATLYVEAIDRAGNSSGDPTPSLSFSVPDSQPTLTWVSGVPRPGGTSVFTATPGTGVTNVTAYQWERDQGAPETRVHARADGSGKLTITWPDDADYVTTLQVQSISADGYVSTGTNQFVFVGPSPWITSPDYPLNFAPAGGVGIPSDFQIINRDPGAQSVQYQFDSDPAVTVPLVHGRTMISYTPTATGAHELLVTPILKTGPDDLHAGSYQFQVAVAGD